MTATALFGALFLQGARRFFRQRTAADRVKEKNGRGQKVLSVISWSVVAQQ